MVLVFNLFAIVLPGAPVVLAFLASLVLFVIVVGVFNVYVWTVYYTSLYIIWTVATEEADG